MTSTTPIELYDIRLYDHDGNIISLLRNWSYLEYHQRLNAPWNHQLTFEMSYANPFASTLRDMVKDNIILIWRTDPVTLEKTLVYEGFNQTTVDQSRSTGSLIFNLYGVGYTDLLKRRVVIPNIGEEHNAKSGFAENVMKEYVADCTTLAGLDRQMPWLQIEAPAGGGNVIAYTARYVSLMTVIENLSQDGKVDFGIVGSVPLGTFTFQARELWGIDRRPGNPTGTPPTIFSLEHDNMDIPIFSTNASEEKNYVYVGGQGVGIDREIVEVSRAAAIAESPWGRKEAFTDARQEGETDGLQATGDSYLEYNAAKSDITFNPRQTLGCRWPRDYGLGDIVRSIYYGNAFDHKITEIVGKVQPGQGDALIENISAEMELYSG